MKKQLVSLFIIIALLLSGSSYADTVLEVNSFSQNKVRVTYSVHDSKVGNNFLIWPERGVSYSDKPITNTSVVDTAHGYQLKHKLVRAPKNKKASALRIEYPNPTPTGGTDLKVSFDLTYSGVGIENSDNYFIKFQTVDPLTVIVPKGYYLTYSNLPVGITVNNGKSFLKIYNPKIRHNKYYKNRKQYEVYLRMVKAKVIKPTK